MKCFMRKVLWGSVLREKFECFDDLLYSKNKQKKSKLFRKFFAANEQYYRYFSSRKKHRNYLCKFLLSLWINCFVLPLFYLLFVTQLAWMLINCMLINTNCLQVMQYLRLTLKFWRGPEMTLMYFVLKHELLHYCWYLPVQQLKFLYWQVLKNSICQADLVLCSLVNLVLCTWWLE